MATSRSSASGRSAAIGRAIARTMAVLVALIATGFAATTSLPAQSPALPGQSPVDSLASHSALELRFLDVGQGDAVLIRAPDGRAVLYDGGEDGGRLLALLEQADVRSLEVVIASHNHADHIGGLTEVIARYRPRFVIENGVPHTTRTYERFLRAVANAGSQRLEPTRRTLTLDSVRLTILPPPPGRSKDQNDNSIGVRIEYGAFSATLLGDSEAAQQQWWLTRHADLLRPVEIHKASHHGSRNGDTRAMLASLQPEVVVIGVGADNRYGHPHPAALGRYRQRGADLYRTDQHGTVTVMAERDGTYRLRRGGRVVAAAAPSPADHPAEYRAGRCVDVNRAGPNALKAIIHIGPERAGQIMRLRAQRPFASVADLTRVRGIGEVRARDIARQGVACVGAGRR